MTTWLPKLPEGVSYGVIFSNISGKQLDAYGKMCGTRRRWFEVDTLYKRRLAKEYIAIQTE